MGTCRAAKQHLQRYLTKFDFRHAFRSALGVSDVMRADEALRGIAGRRLTYRRVGEAAHALAEGEPTPVDATF